METLSKSTMTQQEIFQNMTKGEWMSEDGFIINKDGSQIADFVPKESNSLAIVFAVNNTYGKGINPESVGEWKAFLTELAEYDERKHHLTIEYISQRAKEALTAAKL